MAKEKKKSTFWADFKAFISRGNVLDMAVGVVIGSAFGAIVTALVNILLSLCLWAVPGGLKGLVTVLPALNDAQKGMDPSNGLGQMFDASQLQALAKAEAIATYDAATVEGNPNLIESVKGTILGKYTLHGTQYTYNMSSVIDWGAFINAIISFIIIAFVLFIIVRIVAKANRMREEAKAKLEAKKAAAKAEGEENAEEAEEAPAEEAPAEEAVDPVVALLTEIRDSLKKAE